LWFQHPRLIPEQDLDELPLPHREIMAHRDSFRIGKLRNPYAGLRDQPLLHPDTSRAPETNSRLPELGPPPPRHTIKTFGTLTSLALVGVGVYALAPSDFTGVAKGKAKDKAWNNFQDAWTKPPVVDKDDYIVITWGIHTSAHSITSPNETTVKAPCIAFCSHRLPPPASNISSRAGQSGLAFKI
jgi:hypothetical protein